MFSLFPQSVIHAKTPNPPASDLVKTLFSNMYDLIMYTELTPWRWSFVPDRVTFVSIQKASGCQVNLVIDAEQSYLQLAIDNITIDLMRVFNKRRPVISNTYQNYLKVIGHLTLAAITGTIIMVSNLLVKPPLSIWILQTSLVYFNWDSAEFLQLFLLMDHIYVKSALVQAVTCCRFGTWTNKIKPGYIFPGGHNVKKSQIPMFLHIAARVWGHRWYKHEKWGL